MYYEDVEVQQGETFANLIIAYGHEASYGTTIWQNPRNGELRAARERPERIEPGDQLYIPIPWKIMSTSLTYTTEERIQVLFDARRTGGRGTRLRWVQTVDSGNQPLGYDLHGAPRFVVDPSSPPTDNEPFVLTLAELAANPEKRRWIFDAPFRPPPSRAMGTTEWRALLSIAIATRKRVTVVDTHYWGFDRESEGTVRRVPARRATPLEVQDHLEILRGGFGLGDGPGTKAYFSAMGWIFRTPPTSQLV